MNLKEHLQFLILMIPTLLLIVAAAVTLAAPGRSTAPASAEATTVESVVRQDIVTVDTEIGPAPTVVIR